MYISDGAGSGDWTDTGATIGSSSFTTGDLKPTFKTTADSGWIMCDDGTIGDVSSSATNLASATTSDLYSLIWANFANTEAAVSTGRGASAAADYSAHKTIALPKMLGRVYGIAGIGSGLTTRALGKTVGEESHALIEAEIGPHTHTTTVSQATNQESRNLLNDGTDSAITVVRTAASSGLVSNTGSGSGTAHNTMQPTVFLNMMVKL